MRAAIAEFEYSDDYFGELRNTSVIHGVVYTWWDYGSGLLKTDYLGPGERHEDNPMPFPGMQTVLHDSDYETRRRIGGQMQAAYRLAQRFVMEIEK